MVDEYRIANSYNYQLSNTISTMNIPHCNVPLNTTNSSSKLVSACNVMYSFAPTAKAEVNKTSNACSWGAAIHIKLL